MRKIILLFTVAVFFTSCNIFQGPQKPDENGINFDWKTTTVVNLKVEAQSSGAFLSTVKVFFDESMDSGSLIAEGASSSTNPFNANLTIPIAADYLYVSVKSSNGYKFYKYAVSESVVINTANAESWLPDMAETKSGVVDMKEIPSVTIPELNEMTILNSTSDIPTTEMEGKFYIPAGVTIEINEKGPFGDATKNWNSKKVRDIYVAGTLKIKSTPGKNMTSTRFVVMDGGKIEADSMRVQGNSVSNFRDTPIYYVMEGGEMNLTGDLTLNGSQIMVNKGLVYVDKLATNTNSKLYVTGRLTARYMNLAWPETWTASEIYLYPGSLLEATDIYYAGHSTTIYLYEESILYIGGKANLGPANYITPTTGGYSLIYINATSYATNGYGFSHDGNIEIFVPTASTLYSAYSYTNTFIPKMTSTLSNGAILVEDWDGRVVFIKDNIINKGYGEYERKDKDGDGVSAEDDIDDNDPEVAYKQYYPSQDTFATVMFEDLWPSVGDYDMNDIVCDIRVEWTMNASNDVVYMEYIWKLRAAGAATHNSLAVQLDDITINEIGNVVSTLVIAGDVPFKVANGMEEGMSKVVLPLFNDVKDVLDGYWNMVNTGMGSFIPYDRESVKVKFTEPVSQERVAINKLNIFLVPLEGVDAVTGSRVEIHLPEYAATEKAILLEDNAKLNPNNPYLSKTGMMWGLMVPQSIAYPIEEINIENVYPRYKSWYESEGTKDTDWYKDIPAAGKVFVEPVITEGE